MLLTILGAIATIFPLIAKIAYPLLDAWAGSKLATAKFKREYPGFLEIMSQKGDASAQRRLSAQKQIDAVNKAWEEEKAGGPK